MSANFSNYAHSEREKYLWPAAFLILIGWGAVLLEGGYAHYEGQFFLANYVDGRGLLSKIFSAHHNEWDCYQGRELSFLFGWLDAQAVVVGARSGAPHLYSVTHFAGLIAIAVMLWRLLPRLFAGVDRTLSGLIVCLFLSSPVASLSGFYYRPAKILTALFLVIALGRMDELMRSPIETPRTRRLVLLAISATLMGMSDRLGVYLILLIGMMVIVAGPLARAARVLVALGAALAANILWSVAVGPRLSFMADGYLPDTTDQRVRLRFTFLDPDHYGPAVSLWLDHVSQYFGNGGLYAGVIVTILMAASLWRTGEGYSAPWRQKGFVMLLVAVLASIALYVAMFARLESLIWPASRRVYYWLPQLVCIAVATAAALGRIRVENHRLAHVVNPLLAVLILANLIALPAHRTAARSQEHAPWVAESGRLRSCMSSSTAAVASYWLSAPAAQVCGAVRVAARGTAGPGPQVPVAKANPVLYCRKSGRKRDRVVVTASRLRSSLDDAIAALRGGRVSRASRAGS